jgi:hypothetical protein
VTDSTIVRAGYLQYRFPNVEEACKARIWLNQRGPLFNPADFSSAFPTAKLVTSTSNDPVTADRIGLVIEPPAQDHGAAGR